MRDMFGRSPFLGGFFTAQPTQKWPVVWGPPPYGIWPATVAVPPGVDPPEDVENSLEWEAANQQYRRAYGMGSGGPMRCVNVR